ncbi:MAG: magnesium transporter CorA family protein [Inhella sp.]|jgi:magnesium transporter|uniref:magnesium transporter CorA family protein n=1 Tax=Inhella sp. TaxID=1921806 RepID=UPI0022BE9B62|nr:magnesium transporter CorA family protein [Inhella sp.]MCZ8235196.1 magnesium transporter CorA family protein [Inhella sp.]
MQAWHVHERLQTLEPLPLDLPDGGFVWLAVDRALLRDQFAEVQARLAHWTGTPLLELHVSDLLNEELPSHFDDTRAYDLLVLRRLAPTADVLRLDTQAVGFAVWGRVLLSVHPADCAVREHFAQRLAQWASPDAGPRRLPASPDELMLRMLNHMVDGYLDLRRQLTRHHGDLQQALLDTRHPYQDWSSLLAARGNLHKLEDLCEDQRAAVQEWLDALTDAQDPGRDARDERDSLRVRARDVIEHIERVLGHAHRLGLATEGAVQMHYAALGHRTNNIMRVLTALTAVFLPLNLITGFFGMNFDNLPLIHSATGAWVTLGLMTAIGLGLGWWLRRKRYISSR